MEESYKRKNNLLYAVIGVLTLAITVMGATFAYFTATRTVNNVIKGNMATINFSLAVEKKTNVDDVKGGLIPMTNSMIEKAVNVESRTGTKANGICVDDNGNAVCQIYKITATNTGTASMFVDGYVTLTGGSGVATDDNTATTTMRWAQVFCEESSNTLSACTTAGTSTVRQTNTSGFTWTALGSGQNSQNDAAEIKKSFSGTGGVINTATISGNTYPAINTNYIRISKHTGTTYVPATDVTSALVYNQFLSPNDNVSNNNTGDSYTPTTYTDSQVYYIVIWLTETGTNQTAGSGGTNVPATTSRFFEGTVTFITAQGSEITSKFTGYTAVSPDTITN